MSHPLVDIREQLRQSAGADDRGGEYRKEIQDLFRDYRHPWDILTEVIQNAVDAINASNTIDEGIIDIAVCPNNRTLTVKDNGIGIPAARLRDVLVPTVSIDKSSLRTYGYKGVGLSFVAHLTRNFKVESVHDGQRSCYTLANSLDWVVGRAGSRVSESLDPATDTGDHTGTTVTITLDGRYSDTELRTLQSLDQFFSWANVPEILEFVLRTRTAIGNTKTYFGQQPRKPIRVSITTETVQRKDIDFSLLTPFDSQYSTVNRYKIDQRVDGRRPYLDIFLDSTLRDADKVFRCLRWDKSAMRVGSQRRTRTNFDLSVLVCGETGLSELEGQFRIADVDNEIRHSFRSGTGVYLSIDGMPTGIRIHHWTDGFNKRFLCYVDVGMEANSELDKGRKGISEHTRNLIVNAIDEALSDKWIGQRFSVRQTARRMKERQSRGYAGTDCQTHLEKWDQTPDVLVGCTLRKAPLDENGIILLFAELIGRDGLHGYELRYISQEATFDFAFTYRVIPNRIDTSEFSVSRGFLDQLGYDIEQEDHILRGPRGLNWHTGEFKLKAEDIIGRENQPIGELDLLVVWDFNEEQITRRGGNVREASADRRAFEGVTHLLDDDSGECQVIVLKRVLEARGDFVG